VLPARPWMIDHEAHARRETRARLIGSGIPLEHVDAIVDLGFRASQRSIDVLHDTVFGAGDQRVSITALGIALSLTMQRMAHLQAEMIRIGGDGGLPVKSFFVQLDPDSER